MRRKARIALNPNARCYRGQTDRGKHFPKYLAEAKAELEAELEKTQRRLCMINELIALYEA